jgi:outer membrane receptor protein involved in Fe transport
MTLVCRTALAVLVAFAAAGTQSVRAQTPPAQAAPQKPEQKPEQKPDQPPTFEETVVVSASKAEEKLIDAPATMSVITSLSIETAPSANFAELLRAIPGVNVTQVSARDINLTSRAATGTLATGQLALLDGRSLYQDFFGFVMWDFLPVNFSEIKQVEVIRGPASAVWGANAMYGVVNVISKSPREMQGASDPTSVPDRHLPIRCSSTPARPSRNSTPASTTTTRTAASCRSRAASPVPTASCTPASVPSTSTAAR